MEVGDYKPLAESEESKKEKIKAREMKQGKVMEDKDMDVSLALGNRTGEEKKDTKDKMSKMP